MKKRSRMLAAAGLVVGTMGAGGLLAAETALAQTGTPTTTASAGSTASGGSTAVPPELKARIGKACARVPALQDKVQNRLERLQGGADTKGSIAWLEARKDKADAAGHPKVVDVLTTRIEIRTKMVPILELRLKELGQMADLCQEAGAGA